MNPLPEMPVGVEDDDMAVLDAGLDALLRAYAA
jgi:hypothetical protein